MNYLSNFVRHGDPNLDTERLFMFVEIKNMGHIFSNSTDFEVLNIFVKIVYFLFTIFAKCMDELIFAHLLY